MIIKKTKIPFKAVASTGILPSFFKKLLYRARGYKIGKNVSIGLGSIIIGKNVVIEDGVKIGLASIIRANDITISLYLRLAKIISFHYKRTNFINIIRFKRMIFDISTILNI
jgi:NDP-sugar pyrophosphorylase family protein